MIAETSAFLTWALSTNAPIPRVPYRRVSDGGFSRFVRVPAARAAMEHWWRLAFRTMDRWNS